MAYCKNYENTIKGFPFGATDLTDEEIERVMKGHLEPSFWKAHKREPDQYAYVRRWASIVRREAVKRGLV